MDDMVAFLLARCDEREAKALKASPGPWRANAEHDEVLAADGLTVADGFALSGPQLRATVDHIADNDPVFVLAEVDAKRRLLELHGLVHREIGWHDDENDEVYGEIPVCGRCVPKHSHYLRREDVPEGPCATIRTLALPHAGHPDYRVGWRP